MVLDAGFVWANSYPSGVTPIGLARTRTASVYGSVYNDWTTFLDVRPSERPAAAYQHWMQEKNMTRAQIDAASDNWAKSHGLIPMDWTNRGAYVGPLTPGLDIGVSTNYGMKGGSYVRITDSQGNPIGPNDGIFRVADRGSNQGLEKQSKEGALDFYSGESEGLDKYFKDLNASGEKLNVQPVSLTPEAEARLKQVAAENAQDFDPGASQNAGGEYSIQKNRVTEAGTLRECLESKKMDSKAECESSYAKVIEAEGVGKRVHYLGQSFVQQDGARAQKEALSAGPNSIRSPLQEAMGVANNTTEVLENAAKINQEMARQQNDNAKRHLEMAYRLKERIKREWRSVGDMKADSKDLTSDGQSGGAYFAKGDTIQKFKMNQAGKVNAQQCDQSTDPGCKMAAEKRRKGLEAKKTHLNKLLNQVNKKVQQQQAEAMKVSRLGAEASQKLADQQSKDAKMARDIASKLNSELQEISGNEGDSAVVVPSEAQSDDSAPLQMSLNPSLQNP
ncbi:hypothetical protein EBZ37_04285 [bacterium]|nr:hypothetical protein [bacterium]